MPNRPVPKPPRTRRKKVDRAKPYKTLAEAIRPIMYDPEVWKHYRDRAREGLLSAQELALFMDRAEGKVKDKLDLEVTRTVIQLVSEDGEPLSLPEPEDSQSEIRVIAE